MKFYVYFMNFTWSGRLRERVSLDAGRAIQAGLEIPMPYRSILLPVLAILASASPPAPVLAQTIRPDSDEDVQWSASVVRVDPLHRQGGITAKLFGTAGGDPAMNGLYTYLAFFGSPDEGWRAFRLGDFLDYRLLSEAPGRLTLEVRESVMNQRTGVIGERTRRLLVGWRARGEEPPATVSVTATR